MAKTFLLAVVTLYLVHDTLAVTYTQTEIDDAVDACDGLIDDDESFIGGLVRLAFHDCIGGCDGCVDTAIPDNAGLSNYIVPLNEAYNDLTLTGNTMGRADFWATCWNAAALAGFNKLQNRFRRDIFPFKTTYGRIDGECDDLPDRPFPSALHGLNETLAYFADNFGFNTNETVALLGAHTLGRTRIENSGFNGPWVGRPDMLDTQYYRAILAPWRQDQQDVDGTLTNWQWINPVNSSPPPNPSDTTVMLNSDLCLGFEVTPNAEGENNPKRARLIPHAVTRPLVEHYAADIQGWLIDFDKVFTKLGTHGMPSPLSPLTQLFITTSFDY